MNDVIKWVLFIVLVAAVLLSFLLLVSCGRKPNTYKPMVVDPNKVKPKDIDISRLLESSGGGKLNFFALIGLGIAGFTFVNGKPKMAIGIAVTCIIPIVGALMITAYPKLIGGIGVGCLVLAVVGFVWSLFTEKGFWNLLRRE